MHMDEYQLRASRTAVYPREQTGGVTGVVYTALGLAGEAGEVANKVKKVFRDHDGELTHELRDAIIEELGDTLWYVAMLADELGLVLSRVADVNLHKLGRRASDNRLHGSGDTR